MTHPALIERITRSLAYMLRHQPEEFDLEVDDHGYAELAEVVRALNERLGESVAEDDVREATESGDRQRYEIVGDRIRALYGHSIDVLPGEPARPPERLYVGVSRADADRARRYGLRPGRRRFLHLALTPEDALETAQRTAREHEVIVVRALDAWEDGVNFYDRISLFLSDPIPTQYLEGPTRGAPAARPAPVRHAREEIVYARPEDDDERGPEEGDDAPRANGGEFGVGAADAPREGGGRRRRGRRGRRRGEGSGPAERAPAHAAHEGAEDEFTEHAPYDPEFRPPQEATERGGPGRPAYGEAPRGGSAPRRDAPRRDEPRHEGPRRDEPRREPPAGAPRRDERGGQGRGGDRPWSSERPAARADDRGGERPRADRPSAPERGYDDRPRHHDRPRHEDAPRQEAAARGFERPRGEDRSRGDRPREERPRRAEPPREERGHEPRPGGRPDVARPAPRRDEIPRPSEPAIRRHEPEPSGGFGLGLDDAPARPAQRPAPPPPAPPRPAPRREEPRPTPSDDGGSFGAGIL